MVTLLLSLVAATPVITNDGDAWTVDGKPLAQSCQTLRVAKTAAIETEVSWKQLEPVVAEARKCGVSRVSLRAGGELANLSLRAGDDPVVVIERNTHVVHGGASAAVQLDRRGALLWRAFPTMVRPCLAVAPTARASAIVESATALLRGAGERPARVCLLVGDDVAELPSAERTVVDLLLGGEGGPPGPAGDGHLTRWFGRSVAPVAEEREVPRWTRISNMVCRGESGVQIWGVGTVSGIRNHALARTTADNRARAGIATYVSTEISRSKKAVKTFTAQTLSGVQIVDHYIEGKSVYALAVMDTHQKAAEPCPTGSEVVRAWRWRGLDPQGGFGSERPSWARGGIEADDDELWVTTSSRTNRPLAESNALLETLARSRLTAALTQGVLGVPARQRSDDGSDCLTSVPWAEVGNSAAVQAWYDVESGKLFARARVDLDEVRAALGPGCEGALVKELVTASRRVSAPAIVRSAPVIPANVKYPEWVLRGSGAAGAGNGRVFYGVGSVSGIKNHALARVTADNRARAEVAKIFEVYSAMLMKDYMMHTDKRGVTNRRTGEQHIGMAIKTFSAMTLSGVQIVDHWFHPDGTVYALAQLDLDAFEGNIGTMREINKQVRDYVRKNAERVHQELRGQEERRR